MFPGDSTVQMLLMALAVGCGVPALIYLACKGTLREPEKREVAEKREVSVVNTAISQSPTPQASTLQAPRKPILLTDLYDLENPPKPKYVKAKIVGCLITEDYQPFPAQISIYIPEDVMQQLVQREILKQAGFPVGEEQKATEEKVEEKKVEQPTSESGQQQPVEPSGKKPLIWRVEK